MRLVLERRGIAMDQLSAHLDRAWDLIRKGDVRGAQTSAQQALDIDSQSPEAHNLLGFVASLQGDVDECHIQKHDNC